MNPTFSPTVVRPNRPLRKPLSSPGPISLTSPPGMFPTMMTHPLIRTPSEGLPVISQSSPVLGLSPPTLSLHLCNYCGQKGNFRCKRCKKTHYCSAVCQTEDWRAHRHTCEPIEPEPAKEKPKENIAVQGDLMPNDSSSSKRLYLKDLNITKINKGAEIQGSVVELHSPGRFFLLAQLPEMLEALQIISTELQKTCCSLSGTPYVPVVGEICAAQFSCDRNWYRGLVQTLAADQKVANILYIDFGNEESVPVDRIRPLPANIQPFCPCAMECRIAGVVPVFKDWSGECCMTVKRLLAGKTVTVKLLEALEDSQVHAVDILLSPGKQLSSFLIEEGYGVKETASAEPTEQDISAMLSASLENFKCLSDGKDDNEWAQPPEPLPQSVGDQIFVVVTHFQSPNDLVVQKVENAGVIQDLQLKLREHCTQVESIQNFRPAPGTVCCAQFSEDKQWYRAKVLAYPSVEHVCVGYLDFGNSEKVDLSHLRPISSSLLSLPMQAILCGLAYIESTEQRIVNGVKPVEESWSKECLFALQRCVSNKILRIEILAAHEGKFLVAMFDECGDPQDNIAKQLISAGYASAAPVSTGPRLKAEETTATAEQSASPVSEPLVCTTVELPSDGQKVALVISTAESLSKFYCRLNSPTEHQKLMGLGVQLKQHCETCTSHFVPSVGEPCCAMFSGDGSWCRAMVKGISEDSVTVNCVDYGYDMAVEKNHLRSITPELLKLPFQAIRCWLAGVEPLGSGWDSEALLWFQSHVDGEHLTARVLSITEQGYGVELESRGQNVAASLIFEQFAKAPGEHPKESPIKTGSITKQQEDHFQASNQAEVNSREITSEKQKAVPSEAFFPVDWKTVELPLHEIFQPYIAAVISPSLFYVLGSTQVDQKKLQEVMMELAAYCSSYKDTGVKSKPAPGAACCAQFSADNNWYRAVVLEVGEHDMSIIYADYGNKEKVPFSRILPIPSHLLQLPFLIARCSLTGKEHFPADWPKEVQQMFQTELVNGVLAQVESFDGSANVLSVTVPTERGGTHLTAVILDALKPEMNPYPDSCLKSDKASSSTSQSASVAPGCNQPKFLPESQSALEKKSWPVDLTGQTKSAEPTTECVSAASVSGGLTHNFSVIAGVFSADPVKKIVDQMKPLCQNSSAVTDPLTSSCCCQRLKKLIDKMEQLVELQLTLIKQLEKKG